MFYHVAQYLIAIWHVHLLLPPSLLATLSSSTLSFLFVGQSCLAFFYLTLCQPMRVMHIYSVPKDCSTADYIIPIQFSQLWANKVEKLKLNKLSKNQQNKKIVSCLSAGMSPGGVESQCFSEQAPRLKKEKKQAVCHFLLLISQGSPIVLKLILFIYLFVYFEILFFLDWVSLSCPG